MKKNSLEKEIISIFKTFVICFIIVFLINKFLFLHVIVEGSSMNPTLETKEVGFTNIIGKTLFGIERFDIVVIKDAENNRFLIKRIIGLPNDEIKYKDNNLYVNGAKVEEDFIDKNQYFTDDLTIKLGEDEYFVLGDNRNNSEDSRFFGPISYNQIISKDIFIIYPFNKFGAK